MSNAKLASKFHSEDQTVVNISGQTTVGGADFLIIGGPCTVESMEQMTAVANKLITAPVQMLREVSTNRAPLPTHSKGWE